MRLRLGNVVGGKIDVHAPKNLFGAIVGVGWEPRLALGEMVRDSLGQLDN